MKLSVVIPVYNAENIVHELVRRLIATLIEVTEDFEIILVEDGSEDNSWAKIQENCISDSRLKGIKLSRNFGQHQATQAGLEIAKGDWIIVMDCDLQDNPSEIIRLYEKAKEGNEIVFARRKNRKDTFLKRLTSMFFYKIFSYLSGVEHDGTTSNFGIYSREVIDNVNSINEPNKSFAIIVRWVGFNTSFIDVEHAERFVGKSSYNWSKLISLAFDILLSHSFKPLKILMNLGLFISLSSIFTVVFSIFYYSINTNNRILFLLFSSVWFLGGVIITMLGLLGLYLEKTTEVIKHRPNYIIQYKLNINS
jgi:dolichol-phosphate mannosyltransferase